MQKLNDMLEAIFHKKLLRSFKKKHPLLFDFSSRTLYIMQVVLSGARKGNFDPCPNERMAPIPCGGILGFKTGVYLPFDQFLYGLGGIGVKIGKDMQVGDYTVDANVKCVYKSPFDLVVSARKNFKNNHRLEVLLDKGISLSRPL